MPKRVLKKIRHKLIHEKKPSDGPPVQDELPLHPVSDPVPASVAEVQKILQDAFHNSSDLVFREIYSANGRLLLVYLDGLSDRALMNADILKPLMQEAREFPEGKHPAGPMVSWLKESIIHYSNVSEVHDLAKSIDEILSGDAMLFIDGADTALSVKSRKWEKREIQEPPNEAVVSGPREGFIETLATNTALLRRIIKNTNLVFEKTQLGRQTKTDVCICYIHGIANDKLIESVRERISQISVDAILESGYIEEFIEAAPFSIFPTIGRSEKPDVVASKILEGRVAILCAGTPIVLTVPYLFIESIQSPEDYYARYVYSITMRPLRMVAAFITSMLPAYYVALVCFHQDVIPFKLLMTMMGSRDGIPFSSLVEALIMIVTFEIIREAGVRMPRPIGQAVSIVGALVIGDAAVNAGLVSTPMVIVIALTAITSFIVTPISGAMLLVRLGAVIAASTMGILGIVLFSVAVFAHMCSLKSFGVPYMSPFAPTSGMDLKDTFIRFPIWAMLTRPESLAGRKGQKNRFRRSGA
jgi:spore germination protein KA